MDKTTHQIHCKQWTRIINEYLASGMSKKEWCRVNGISDTPFYFWKRILRNEAYLDQIQLPAVSEVKPTPLIAFVELKPAPNASNTFTFQPDVIIRNKRSTLELSNTVSIEFLSQLEGLFYDE